MLIESKLCLCPFLWATMLAVGSPVIVLFQLFKRKGETVSLPLRKLAMQASFTLIKKEKKAELIRLTQQLFNWSFSFWPTQLRIRPTVLAVAHQLGIYLQA